MCDMDEQSMSEATVGMNFVELGGTGVFVKVEVTEEGRTQSSNMERARDFLLPTSQRDSRTNVKNSHGAVGEYWVTLPMSTVPLHSPKQTGEAEIVSTQSL